jgi:hypothetical protein
MPNDDNEKVKVTFLNRSGKKSEPVNCHNPIYTSKEFGKARPYPEKPGTSAMSRRPPFNKGNF